MGEEKKGSYTGLGLVLGTGLGATIGLLFFEANEGFTWLMSAGIGTGIGLLIGAALDSHR